MDLRVLTNDTIDQAIGRSHRADPVRPGTGGPAGNARLTAWTGLLLLVLFGAELVTLLDVRGLMSWHVAIGVLLIPPALLKTASTGWRIARYYTGNAPYRAAGPPPLLMRLLGPLVVLTTLAVLASGVVLVLIGTEAGRRSWLTVLGLPLDAETVHKGSFVVWGVITGLHVLGRFWPAWLTTVAGPADAPIPGGHRRAVIIVITLAVAAVAAALLLGVVDLTAWSAPHGFRTRD